MNDSMSPAAPARCPLWCTDHYSRNLHRTEPRIVPTFDKDVTVSAFRYGDSDVAEERVVVGGHVLTLGQAADVARSIQRVLGALGWLAETQPLHAAEGVRGDG